MLVNKLDRSALEEAVVFLRNIWLRMNDSLFNNIIVNPNILAQRAKEELELVHEANKESS